MQEALDLSFDRLMMMMMIVVIFLGTFIKLRKETANFVTSLSVRPSASIPTGRTFKKFVLNIFQNLSKNFNFH